VAYINTADVSSTYGNLIYMKVKTNINLVLQNQFIMQRNSHMIRNTDFVKSYNFYFWTFWTWWICNSNNYFRFRAAWQLHCSYKHNRF